MKNEVVERMQARLDALGFDFQHFTMVRFVSWLETYTGRKVIFVPTPMSSNMDGAWFSDSELPHEYIFYDQSMPPLHQVHTQLHELSHFIIGHATLRLTGKKLISLLQTLKKGNKQPADFQQLILMRSPESNIQEDEAEAFAALIQSRVIKYAKRQELEKAVSKYDSTTTFLQDMGVSC